MSDRKNGYDHRPDDTTGVSRGVCNYELSAPRHFAYPALLLLVAEEPMHGYRLVQALRDLRYGPVSRPNVYRALAELEQDGLLESWSAEPIAGSTRHVYGITAAGRERLHRWMEVVERERDVLGRVIDRFGEWQEDPDRVIEGQSATTAGAD